MGPGQDHDNLNELLEMKGKVSKVKDKRRGHPHQLVMKHSRTQYSKIGCWFDAQMRKFCSDEKKMQARQCASFAKKT